MDLSGLRDYTNRDWAAVRALKEQGWIERLEKSDPAEGLRIVEQLYVDARILRPDWPTDEDRREDFTHHLRLAELLQRASRKRR